MPTLTSVLILPFLLVSVGVLPTKKDKSPDTRPPITLHLNPSVTRVGGDVRVRVEIPPNKGNRVVVITWEGPESGRTMRELEGDNAPSQITFDSFDGRPLLLRSLPEGRYTVQAMLVRVEGETIKRYTDSKQVLVGVGTEDSTDATSVPSTENGLLGRPRKLYMRAIR